MQKVIVVSGPYASDKEWIVQGTAGHMLVLIRWIGFGCAEHAEVRPERVRYISDDVADAAQWAAAYTAQ